MWSSAAPCKFHAAQSHEHIISRDGGGSSDRATPYMQLPNTPNCAPVVAAAESLRFQTLRDLTDN
eukprot:2624740-Pleurochrysis_carterae.AAC.1